MDIHEKSVDMDMDMDAIFHIHGNPGQVSPLLHKTTLTTALTLSGTPYLRPYGFT